MGETDFKEFMRLGNQRVIAAENIGREELIPALSEDMDEQLKLAHKVFDTVDWANGKVCATLLR